MSVAFTVPKSVDVEAVDLLLQILGIDLDLVDMAGVRIAHNAIECEVYALDASGYRYATSNAAGEVVAATHRIQIPINSRG